MEEVQEELLVGGLLAAGRGGQFDEPFAEGLQPQVSACLVDQRVLGITRQGHPPGRNLVDGLFGLRGGIHFAARVLTEIGDDRTRFADARGLKAYAGASPVTRASGKKSSITRRWVKNDRLNHAGKLWAFSAITASPGAKALYRRRRDDHGDWHAAGQRNLFNRMLGQLHHCLKNRHLFDERTAFPAPQAPALAVA